MADSPRRCSRIRPMMSASSRERRRSRPSTGASSTSAPASAIADGTTFSPSTGPGTRQTREMCPVDRRRRRPILRSRRGPAPNRSSRCPADQGRRRGPARPLERDSSRDSPPSWSCRRRLSDWHRRSSDPLSSTLGTVSRSLILPFSAFLPAGSASRQDEGRRLSGPYRHGCGVGIRADGQRPWDDPGPPRCSSSDEVDSRVSRETFAVGL